MTNSGYSKEQIRRVIINGIKGFEGRNRKRRKEGRSIRSTAASSKGSRFLGKLTGKTSWYKKSRRSNIEEYGARNLGANGVTERRSMWSRRLFYLWRTPKMGS